MVSVLKKITFLTSICLFLSFISGCFEFGDPIEVDANNPSDNGVTASGNTPPIISGTALTVATIGQEYLFIPAATDADGDKLTFSITSPPSWAAFDSTTGELRGVPMLGQSAVYANIIISVSDGEMEDSLPPFTINVSQVGNISVTLNWTPPNQNEDGTPLTDLAAYKIYYGISQGEYPNQIHIDNPGITSYVVDDLTPNTYYFVSTSINSSGVESTFSNVATRVAN